MVDSDAEAEEHPSREEIVARHEPIHTYPRPLRKQVYGPRGAALTVAALVVGLLAGLILPSVWLGIVAALFGWMLPSDMITLLVILLLPPAAGICWAMLREREHELYPATKAFLVAMLFGGLFFVYWVPRLLAS